MSGHIFTNPIVKTKVLTYERLAYQTEDVWFREFCIFQSKSELKESLKSCEKSRNIRNASVYDIVMDLSKPCSFFVSIDMRCKGCGVSIESVIDSKHPTICNGEWYCDFDCYCEHNPDKVKQS